MNSTPTPVKSEPIRPIGTSVFGALLTG